MVEKEKKLQKIINLNPDLLSSPADLKPYQKRRKIKVEVM